MMKKTPVLEQTIFYNFLIAAVALILTWVFGGPWMEIEKITAQTIALILFAGFLAISVWAKIIQFRQKGRGTADKGPYKYMRHPIYFAIIFLFNPAVAFFFRSWLLIAALLPIYLIWQNAGRSAELSLVQEFGNDYRNYRLRVPMFFPKFNKIKLVSLIFVGIAIAILVFITLNFQSLYLRYVVWQPSQTSEGPSFVNSAAEPQKSVRVESVKLYNEPDSLVINKLGVRAPLIFAQSDKQKELNADLNRGVVAYPGSVKPGEIGNLFLAGHSSAYPWSNTQYGQIFATLDKLEAGDRVIVYYNQRKFEYEIENKYLISPKDLKLVHPENYSKITLSTCWPIGTDLKRLVVEGTLVKN